MRKARHNAAVGLGLGLGGSGGGGAGGVNPGALALVGGASVYIRDRIGRTEADEMRTGTDLRAGVGVAAGDSTMPTVDPDPVEGPGEKVCLLHCVLGFGFSGSGFLGSLPLFIGGRADAALLSRISPCTACIDLRLVLTSSFLATPSEAPADGRRHGGGCEYGRGAAGEWALFLSFFWFFFGGARCEGEMEVVGKAVTMYDRVWGGVARGGRRGSARSENASEGRKHAMSGSQALLLRATGCLHFFYEIYPPLFLCSPQIPSFLRTV
jgi:hypothetical protein